MTEGEEVLILFARHRVLSQHLKEKSVLIKYTSSVKRFPAPTLCICRLRQQFANHKKCSTLRTSGGDENTKAHLKQYYVL